MARRRQLDGAGGEREVDDASGDFYDEMGGIQGFQSGGDEAFGWSNALSPADLESLQSAQDNGVFENPIAGSGQGPRDLFGTQAPRNLTPPTPPSAPPPASSGPDISELIGMLPQGVEAMSQPDVNTPAQGVESFGAGASSAPMQSSAPQSVSMAATPPADAGAVGPRRQSVSSPVNLVSGGRTGGGLIGRAGGLTQGGIGMPGGPSGGPTATKQMLELLKQLNGGQ